MIILHVLPKLLPNKGGTNALVRRFGNFYSKEMHEVQYPVATVDFGQYIFEKEFGEGTVHEGNIYGAWLVEVPAGFDAADLPVTEENGGEILMEWTRTTGWILP